MIPQQQQQQQPFAMIPQQQQTQQPLSHPVQQPLGMGHPGMQTGYPPQSPYGGFLNAFSDAFDPISQSFMAGRQSRNPHRQQQDQFLPGSSSVQQEEGGLMSASKVDRTASVDALSPVTKALHAYEKLASIADKFSDAAFTQMAAQIWYENIKTPVDPNIFVPVRTTQQFAETPEQTRKRQRDETGRFSSPQSQTQTPVSDDPQQAQQGYPSQGFQASQQQQQQQQSLPSSGSVQLPHQQTQTPMMIPPGMQLVPIFPAHQQQQQPFHGMQIPTQPPISVFDSTKLKQRLGIPIHSQSQQAQQDHQTQQSLSPLHQQQSVPSQFPVPQQQQQQQSVPSQLPVPQQQQQ